MKKHKRGGSREGAGAKPKYGEPTTAKTFRFPESIAKHIGSQKNGTAYLIKLVGADMEKLTDRSG